MPLGMMVLVPEGGFGRPLDPANRPADQAAAADFRELRDGTGFWSFLRFPTLPYANAAGQRRDWFVEVWDGPGRLLRDRLRGPIEDEAYFGADLAALARSFEDIPWIPWIGEKYPYVSEGFYRELGAFLAICVRHGLAVSFKRS